MKIFTTNPSKRSIIAVALTSSVALCALAGASVAASYKTITLEIDGTFQPISGFPQTVGDVISASGVTLGEHDLVAPQRSEKVRSGDTVVVRTATPYSVNIDGRQTKVWSTASSAAGLLSEVSRNGGAVLAANRSTQRSPLLLGKAGQNVTILVDGKSLTQKSESQDDLLSFLARAGIKLSPIDRVAIKSNNGTFVIEVTRVQRDDNVSVEQTNIPLEERQDDSIPEGTSNVIQEGKAGSVTYRVREEKNNGKVVFSHKNVLKEEKGTPKIVAIGAARHTKVQSHNRGSVVEPDNASASSHPAQASAPVGGEWAALAQCESGGNPATNTGNGYYGMYQFSAGTWASVGGAGLPSDASAEEQTMRAQMLQSRSGWGQWPACSSSLGLR